jgi:hypothetical protein
MLIIPAGFEKQLMSAILLQEFLRPASVALLP